MMYVVWHTTGKFDGDSSFDNIDDAKEEFDHQTRQRGVIEVTLESFQHPDSDASTTIRRWSAVENG